MRILNRPAAVSPKTGLSITANATAPLGWEGGQPGVSQKTCKTLYTAGIQ